VSPFFGPALLAGLVSPAVAPCRAEPPTDMACVPGGPFVRGTDTGPADAAPAATVFVQTFYMDRYEVTFEQYRSCVARGKCRHAYPNYPDFDHPRQPMNGVRWFDAVAFCEAAGKHLPTEAEWEKAARGPDGETYPWGDAPADCTRAVIEDARGKSCGVPQRNSHEPEKGRPEIVGSRPPGRYGLFDMAGNSWEWVADWYSPSYGACGQACLGSDPLGPCGGASPCRKHALRVVRGGSWFWGATHASGFFRRAHTPENAPVYHHFGFRCAASVGEAARLLAPRVDVPGTAPAHAPATRP
jgi:formylglycine-generating enzyme required for sulfatase activity